MTERTLAPIVVTAARIGRTDLGEATLIIEEETLVLALRGAPEVRPVRLPIASIDGATVDPATGELALSLREGPRFTIASESAAEVRAEILVRCHALPELTRALRTFGSRRRHTSVRAHASADQQRFFAPLLDARRRAGLTPTARQALDAFDAASLAAAFNAAIHAFVSDRYSQNGPGRRALEAELSDAIEPLLLAIEELGQASVAAGVALDDLRLWRIWANQLRYIFETADRAWMGLDAALDATPWRS